MNRYKVTFQTVMNGKVVSTAGTSVNADSIAEARQKVLGSHTPTNTKKIVIVSCVKQ